jgi:hypothetical protein
VAEFFAMKFVSAIFAIILLLVGKQFGFSQAFVNLDFENATIAPTSPPGFYPVTTALPGWTVSIGTNQQTEMGYQTVSTGQTFVSLLGANGPFGFSSISGLYSVLLQGGVTSPDATISQTGLVPVLTESILFEGQAGAGPLLLSLGGQNIPVLIVGTGPNYTMYGGNVSAFAGQTEQLEFSAPEGYNENNYWNIDNIQFSPSAIPEPSQFALGALGALLLGFRRWRNYLRA